MQNPEDHHPEIMDTFPGSPVEGSIYEQMNSPPEEINKSTPPAGHPLSPSSKYSPDHEVKRCNGNSTDEEDAELSDEVRNFLSSNVHPQVHSVFLAKLLRQVLHIAGQRDELFYCNPFRTTISSQSGYRYWE